MSSHAFGSDRKTQQAPSGLDGLVFPSAPDATVRTDAGGRPGGEAAPINFDDILPSAGTGAPGGNNNNNNNGGGGGGGFGFELPSIPSSKAPTGTLPGGPPPAAGGGGADVDDLDFGKHVPIVVCF